jgi:Right handed beta helix region
MWVLRYSAILALALAAFGASSSRASAASSYDNCVNYIDAVPLNISTPGTWCLRQDVITNATVGRAVNIQSSNVTIDCNGFRLSNLPAGTGTSSTGVFAWGWSNVTVRNCTIQGFGIGILVTGSSPGTGLPPGTGHVIEKNRLQQNRYSGIEIVGFGSIIRGNIITHTGGRPQGGFAWGIRALGGVDIIDNVVDGIVDDGVVTSFQSIGIFISDFAGFNPDITSSGMRILGNRVRNLARKGADSSVGINVTGTGIWIGDNLIGQPTLTIGAGVWCEGDARVRDNVVKNYRNGMGGTCADDGGNVAY